jgi:hypothetical protein
MSPSSAARLRRGFCAGLAIAALIACDGGSVESEPPGGREVVVSSGDPVEGTGGSPAVCRRAAEVVTRAAFRKPGRLRGDVDGDGARDELFLAVARSGRRGCRAFLAADTGERTLAAPIPDDFVSFDLGLPALRALAAINDVEGAEIVVDVGAGASTQFAAVFTVTDGNLLQVVPPRTGNAQLFAYGGSVGHVDAVDCDARGRIVISSAVPRRDRYQVTRRFATAHGAVWRTDPSATERIRVSPPRLRDYHEFVRSPFGSCPVQ